MELNIKNTLKYTGFSTTWLLYILEYIGHLMKEPHCMTNHAEVLDLMLYSITRVTLKTRYSSCFSWWYFVDFTAGVWAEPYHTTRVWECR